MNPSWLLALMCFLLFGRAVFKVLNSGAIAGATPTLIGCADPCLFRELGAQIACMWECDPAIAAEYNFVPSHFLNLRTSPAKSASFLVAGEVFRRYPRGRRMPGEDLDTAEYRFGPLAFHLPRTRAGLSAKTH
ncbi:MAG: hypothetical protein ACREIA_21560 [Opitutaceae bacterium]